MAKILNGRLFALSGSLFFLLAANVAHSSPKNPETPTVTVVCTGLIRSAEPDPETVSFTQEFSLPFLKPLKNKLTLEHFLPRESAGSLVTSLIRADDQLQQSYVSFDKNGEPSLFAAEILLDGDASLLVIEYMKNSPARSRFIVRDEKGDKRFEILGKKVTCERRR